MVPVFRSSLAGAIALSALCLSAPLSAQTPTRGDTIVYDLDPIVVTATRGPRELSTVPRPVTVVPRIQMERQLPNTVSDLFRNLQGLDVAGVGVNQGRPQIRGLKGQRVLLLSDGMRLNNSRRQSDFGELPALVDVNAVERVEVVRGPASVLYGSDALGGVVNVITREPQRDGLHGSAAFRYGDVEDQLAGTVRVLGRFDRLSVRAGATVRQAEAYFAPAGSFGDVVLTDETLVNQTGTEDRNFDTRLGWDFGAHDVFASFERYDAENSGFGYVNPDAYDPGGTAIEITYPTQRYARTTIGYRGAFDLAIADQLEITAYGQDNERELRFGIGPFPAGPGATIQIDNLNDTDIRTYGGRAEARKLATPDLLLTYGVDVWRDRARGTDLNTTTYTGFGPAPFDDVTTRPQLPDASYLSVGAFVQGEIDAGDRVKLVVGGRYQHVAAETYDTEGLEDQTPASITDGTLVGSFNAIVDVTDELSAVGTVGRGFRSPNLIERFFDGPTPEGAGYQERNPDLSPETSLNFDAGLRYRRGRFGAEVFAFRNLIHDGIRIAPTGNMIMGQPSYVNVNVDELLFRGVEFGFDAGLAAGFSLLGSYTWLDTEDRTPVCSEVPGGTPGVDCVDQPVDNPVGEAFSSKVAATLRWDAPNRRLWLAGDVRRNGEQKEAGFAPGNPIGETVPSFTVMNLRGGVLVWRSDSGMEHRLNVALTNLTNELYAEFSNAGFFRPEPKRNLTLGWSVSF